VVILATKRQKKGIVAFLIAVVLISLVTSWVSFGAHYPVRNESPPPQQYYQTDFWNLSSVRSDIGIIENTSLHYETVANHGETVNVTKWNFKFYSHVYSGIEIWINALLMMKANHSQSMPGILMLHGYGQTIDDLEGMMEHFAAEGYVAMAIDAPGVGDSTDFPLLNPYTFLNISDGPQSAHLYHSVTAATRGLTILESLQYVDNRSTTLIGISMGGLQTYILSGIDSRIEASVVMLAAGNFRDSIIAGTFLNGVINPDYSTTSYEVELIIRWFDPLAYTPMITHPVYLLFGTDDEYFTLSSFEDTIDSIDSELSLCIRPNHGHRVEEHWTTNIVNWLDSVHNEQTLPSITMSYTVSLIPVGNTIRVDSELSNNETAILCWRTSEPGATWLTTPMTHEGANRYYASIFPAIPAKVTFFVATGSAYSYYVSTSTASTRAGSYGVMLIGLLAALSLSWIIYSGYYPLSSLNLQQEIPIITGSLLTIAGFVLPFIVIEGRTGLSLVDFIEQYGHIFLVGGWLLPVVLGLICITLALSSFRHKLPLRIIAAGWLPLLVVFVVEFILFSGFFAIQGTVSLVRNGIGSYLLLMAVPTILILESVSRRYLRQ
jgi:pimeloyl-ACP methyl ester carboxylesterase